MNGGKAWKGEKQKRDRVSEGDGGVARECAGWQKA
jgi:hypothetical protein